MGVFRDIWDFFKEARGIVVAGRLEHIEEERGLSEVLELKDKQIYNYSEAFSEWQNRELSLREQIIAESKARMEQSLEFNRLALQMQSQIKDLQRQLKEQQEENARYLEELEAALDKIKELKEALSTQVEQLSIVSKELEQYKKQGGKR